LREADGIVCGTIGYPIDEVLGELAAALDGRWEDHHSVQARILLDNIATLNRQIDQLTAQVSELISQIPVACTAWGGASC